MTKQQIKSFLLGTNIKPIKMTITSPMQQIKKDAALIAKTGIRKQYSK